MVQALPSTILGFNKSLLKVADLDKMVNFYTKTIGLKLFKTRRGTCLASATRHQRCNSCLKKN